MKQYKINDTIIYNESLREITSLQDKTIIKMTHMRAQCLSFLLRNAKRDLITREIVTEAIWGQKGKFISDASLTQLLYLLRRDLKQIGLDELFTTLPRQGLKIKEGAINLVGVSEVLGRAVLTLCKPYTITLYW